MAGKKKKTTKRKGKKSQKTHLSWLIPVLLIIVAALGFRWWQIRRAGFAHYAEFGIDIPTDYTIHGIDVSKYQDFIDWKEVKNMETEGVRLHFAFMKATEGVRNRDKQFKRNWRLSKEAGMVRGAYHFFVASKDGRMQAENFIKQVDLEKGDLPPVLDVEQMNGVNTARLRAEVIEWLVVIENHYGVKPILYTNVDFYKTKLGDAFDVYPLWIAHYYQHRRPRIDKPWAFWQHSEKGRVNGILSKVDFNVFSGDSLEFRNLQIP